MAETMLSEASNQILETFQVRKTVKQKEAFREYLCGELRAMGYEPRVETAKGLFASQNVVVGDPDRAKAVYTAHYDTCAVLPFPNFITPRNLLVYILFNVLICLGFFVAVFVVELAVALICKALGTVPPPEVLSLLGYLLCFFFIFWMLGGGKANRHTANDNTSGVLTLLETARALPEELRGTVCFVFFDNEEKGLFGSKGFVGLHKEARKNVLNINFDCVGDGDSLQFFPGKRLKKDSTVLDALEAAFLPRDGKSVEVVRGFGFYPSDNGNFKRGAGVCALRRSRLWGWYMSRIHTNRDTVLEPENVLLLRDGALRLAERLQNDASAIQ